jgi:uncharacterized coiled-coil DUF342 family protein
MASTKEEMVQLEQSMASVDAEAQALMVSASELNAQVSICVEHLDAKARARAELEAAMKLLAEQEPTRPTHLKAGQTSKVTTDLTAAPERKLTAARDEMSSTQGRIAELEQSIAALAADAEATAKTASKAQEQLGATTEKFVAISRIRAELEANLKVVVGREPTKPTPLDLT